MQIGLIIRRFGERGGGAERYTFRLAHTLMRAGHRVHIFCERAEAGISTEIALHEVAPMKRWYPRFLGPLIFHWAVQKKIRETSPMMDVIWAMTPTYPVDLYRMSDGIFLHWYRMQSRTPMGRGLRGLLRPVGWVNLFLEKRVLSGGSRYIIANSRLCHHQAIDLYGVDQETIGVVYNGVDRSVFNPNVRALRPEIRKQYGIQAEAQVILFMSMNFKRKGLSRLIDALAVLRPTHPNLCLMVVGKDRRAPYLRQAKRKGIADALYFVPTIPQPAPFYGVADLLVLPTRYDPCANVCLEAMACGVPVITTSQNGASEWITEGVNGFVLDPSANGDTLARKIQEALAPHALAHLRHNAAVMSGVNAPDSNKAIETIFERLTTSSAPILERVPAGGTSACTEILIINQLFRDLLQRHDLLSYDRFMCCQGCVLKDIPLRTMTRVTLDGMEFYLKRHRSTRWRAIPWGQVSEGRREWNHLLAFQRVGLPTPQPVATGERRFSSRSFVMTESLAGYQSLEQWIPSVLSKCQEPDRGTIKSRLVRSVAQLARRMHRAGFYHRDFYLTHLLINTQQLLQGDPSIEIKIIDLQRVIRYPLWQSRWQVKDLAALNFSAPLLFSLRDRLQFYKIYSGGKSLTIADRHRIRAIDRKTGRIARHTVSIFKKRKAKGMAGVRHVL